MSNMVGKTNLWQTQILFGGCNKIWQLGVAFAMHTNIVATIKEFRVGNQFMTDVPMTDYYK